MDKKILDPIIKEASELLDKLLGAKLTELNEIPASSGVYFVFNKDGQVIYIGKAVNLKRRILEDHRGGDEKMSTSTLRRSVSRVYNIVPGRPVKDWIRDNCSFSYILIEEHDLRDLIEALAIAYFRKSGNNLLNFYRKEGISRKIQKKAV